MVSDLVIELLIRMLITECVHTASKLIFNQIIFDCVTKRLIHITVQLHDQTDLKLWYFQFWDC